jgi:hypothetical protein
MPFVVSGNFSHMSDVFLVIFGWILFWIFPQNPDNFPSATDVSVGVSEVLQQPRSIELFDTSYLSWPTLSSEPSSFDQPDLRDSPPWSHSSSSSAFMLTVLLKSLVLVSPGVDGIVASQDRRAPDDILLTFDHFQGKVLNGVHDLGNTSFR